MIKMGIARERGVWSVKCGMGRWRDVRTMNSRHIKHWSDDLNDTSGGLIETTLRTLIVDFAHFKFLVV